MQKQIVGVCGSDGSTRVFIFWYVYGRLRAGEISLL